MPGLMLQHMTDAELQDVQGVIEGLRSQLVDLYPYDSAPNIIHEIVDQLGTHLQNVHLARECPVGFAFIEHIGGSDGR